MDLVTFKKIALGLLIGFSGWLCTSCTTADRHFWYPIKLKSVECASGFKGEVYVMTNSIGWRSWPYFLNPATMREVELGTDCTMETIRELPKHESYPQRKLTAEQRKYVIEGF